MARPTHLSLLAVLSIALIAGPGALVGQQEKLPRLLLTNALVVDGTGAPARHADVLIEGERIAAIESPGTIELGGTFAVEDLAGLVLAPGFIDIHNHSTNRIQGDPAATTQVAQGVTTIVVGADGSSPWPIAEYLGRIETIGPALNVATLVGHGTVRTQVLGDDYRRQASSEQVAAMERLVRRGMEEGAFGLSSGLEYDPGFYSSTEELIDLCRVAAQYGGFYMSHMRDEEEGVLGAIAEAIRIGAATGIPIQISHIKMGNASVWGKAADALALIEQANERGIDVSADQYPYAAWQSGLGIIVSSRRFSDPAQVAQGLADAGGAQRLQITSYEHDATTNGMRLSEIATREGKTDVEMYIEMMRNGGAEIIGHTMNEDDVAAFMVSPRVMTASDGGISSSHPRGAGAFARVLGHYSRELGLLSLERAVQRGTSMPARRLSLGDRGVIRVGAYADLVAFDRDTIADRSTFTKPRITAVGVHKTWVAGTPVWEDGKPTGERPGRVLRRSANR